MDELGGSFAKHVCAQQKDARITRKYQLQESYIDAHGVVAPETCHSALVGRTAGPVPFSECTTGRGHLRYKL